MDKRKYPPTPEMEAINRLMLRRDELLADNKLRREIADRRLELLKEMPDFTWDLEQGAFFCPICGANFNHGHLDSCRLEKELSDAQVDNTVVK